MKWNADGWKQLDQLAEAFTQRCRHRERPSVGEYARDHPRWAEPIQELFPLVVVLEEMSRSSATGSLSKKGPDG